MKDVTFISHCISAFGFALLAALLAGYWRVRPLGAALSGAIVASLLWSSVIAVGTRLEYPPVIAINYLELLRDAAWLYFLLQLSALQTAGSKGAPAGLRSRRLHVVVLAAGVLIVSLRPLQQAGMPGPSGLAGDAVLVLWLLLCIAGLLLIEQIYRNASRMELWGLKFMLLGLGGLFAYDFFMYTGALLFRQLQPELWQARGFVNAIIVPWLAISIARNRHWQMEVYVSRQVVFHTVTLVAMGLYLLGMGLAGYAIKYLGGDWGGVLQVSFLVAATVVLGTLVFSASLRARLRVFISKNFFRNRYDYREEWLKFTEGLAAIEGDPGLGILKNLAPIVLSEGGVLYTRDHSGRLRISAQWRLRAPEMDPDGASWESLRRWLERTGWVIDLDEWRRQPGNYDGLELPDTISAASAAWLVVPLLFQSDLEGIIILRKTPLKSTLVWEDHDLLKTVGRQAASYLAQARTTNELMEVRQFDAFNRLSAYVVHDLKNILAQQSLLVANARKHRDNPAFIDDMVGTIENSVSRMQRLMEQMRSGLRSSKSDSVDITKVLRDVVTARSKFAPAPIARLPEGGLWLNADGERLATVFSHLIQNAQEATEGSAGVRVEVNLTAAADKVTVRISDTGTGMTEEFIRERLFKPFESTKGLTGMGIGAFESREYVRQIGGEMSVSSIVGQGSVFTVTLPATTLEARDSERYHAASTALAGTDG